LRQTLSKYLDHRTHQIDFSIASGSENGYGVKLTSDEIARIRRIQIVACAQLFMLDDWEVIIEDLIKFL